MMWTLPTRGSLERSRVSGATEVERRSLTPKQVEGIVRAEIETREEAATVLEGVGKHEHAERVRAEARVLTPFLEPA